MTIFIIFIFFSILVMSRRLALVGLSYARDLYTCFHGIPYFLRDNRLRVHVFGGGGARLRYLDHTTFRQLWVDAIVGWRPDIVLTWLGANELNQDLCDGSTYNATQFLECYELYMGLCDELRDPNNPMGGGA